MVERLHFGATDKIPECYRGQKTTFHALGDVYVDLKGVIVNDQKTNLTLPYANIAQSEQYKSYDALIATKKQHFSLMVARKKQLWSRRGCVTIASNRKSKKKMIGTTTANANGNANGNANANANNNNKNNNIKSKKMIDESKKTQRAQELTREEQDKKQLENENEITESNALYDLLENNGLDLTTILEELEKTKKPKRKLKNKHPDKKRKKIDNTKRSDDEDAEEEQSEEQSEEQDEEQDEEKHAETEDDEKELKDDQEEDEEENEGDGDENDEENLEDDEEQDKHEEEEEEEIDDDDQAFGGDDDGFLGDQPDLLDHYEDEMIFGDNFDADQSD